MGWLSLSLYMKIYRGGKKSNPKASSAAHLSIETISNVSPSKVVSWSLGRWSM